MKIPKKAIKLMSMDKDSHVIKLLKSAFDNSGKTQKEISTMLNMKQATFSTIINGKHYASLAMYCKIGQLIGVKNEKTAAAYRKDKIKDLDNEIEETLNKL